MLFYINLANYVRILKELLEGYREICNPPLSPFRKVG